MLWLDSVGFLYMIDVVDKCKDVTQIDLISTCIYVLYVFSVHSEVSLFNVMDVVDQCK